MSKKVSENSKPTGYWRLKEEEQPYVDLMSEWMVMSIAV